MTFPDDRIAIILLSNTDGFNEEYIAREIFAVVEHPTAAQLWAERSSQRGENPRNTRIANEVLAQLLAGKLDGSLETPQLHKHMTAKSIASLQRVLASYGSPKNMIFVGRDSNTDAVSEVYRIFYPAAVVSYWIQINAQGKVEGVSFSRED